MLCSAFQSRFINWRVVLRIWCLAIGLGSLLMLGGCAAFVGASGASIVGTQKSPTDHIISLASGKDCSTVRLERGQTFCVEDEVKTTPQFNCYKTIGSVTCYDKKDTRYKPVEDTDYNITTYKN